MSGLIRCARVRLMTDPLKVNLDQMQTRTARRALDLLPREAPPHVVSVYGGASDRGGADLARAARV